MEFIRKIDGAYTQVSEDLYKSIAQQHIKHIRRNFFRVHGIVRVESNETVGLYSRDGLLVMQLTCGQEDIDKFRVVEGQYIKPIPVESLENGQNFPLIK